MQSNKSSGNGFIDFMQPVPIRNNSIYDTPESALWIAVLNTFVMDIHFHRSPYAVAKIIKEAQSRNVFFICNLIGIDHTCFCKGIIRLVKKKALERKKEAQWFPQKPLY